MPSLRVRRIHAAENPNVISELTGALSERWAARGCLASVSDPGYHAALIAGMYAAMATEPEVAVYVRLVERETDAAAESDIPFAAELLRIVLRLDEVAGRSSV